MQIQALNQKIAALDEACQDYEGTISQFRELVGHLQRYFPYDAVSARCSYLISVNLINYATRLRPLRQRVQQLLHKQLR